MNKIATMTPIESNETINVFQEENPSVSYKISKRSDETINVFQGFDEADMHSFYAVRNRFLQHMDATFLLDKCIYSIKENRKYEKTYNQIYSPHYVAPNSIMGPFERDYKYELEYTAETETMISTKAFMEKLDTTLYFWRELNPQLVTLLLAQEYIKREVISNWIKMIFYMAAKEEVSRN